MTKFNLIYWLKYSYLKYLVSQDYEFEAIIA